MKILLIDDLAALLDFAIRAEADGHEVRLYIPNDKSGNRNEVGDGIITKISHWEPSMNWADLIIVSDNCVSIKKLEKYRKLGYPIFGPNVETSDWEIDRDKGIEAFKKAGIKTIDSVLFNNIKDAIKYVKEEAKSDPKKRFVSKPCGDAAKDLSYVSKSPKDMIFMLNHWNKTGKLKAPFIIQKFISGIEFAVGGWFGTAGFSKYYVENFENKKFLAGDLGQNIGESGTILKYVTESKLADIVLKPLEGELYRQGYTGYIDVSVIIDDDGNVWPLELTTRLGFPISQIQQVLHSDTANWMLDLINGKDTFEPYTEIAAGVRIFLPPYPSKPKNDIDVTGFPVYGIDKKNRYFIHPDDMKLGLAPDEDLDEENMLVSCGTQLMEVSGVGNTVKQACENMYEHVKQLEIPNSPIYRNDIGQRVMKQIPELKKLGFAEEW